jgi:hypothetical protein
VPSSFVRVSVPARPELEMPPSGIGRFVSRGSVSGLFRNCSLPTWAAPSTISGPRTSLTRSPNGGKTRASLPSTIRSSIAITVTVWRVAQSSGVNTSCGTTVARPALLPETVSEAVSGPPVARRTTSERPTTLTS